MAKALVVDDSKAVRMIICKTLRELRFDVREAANGKDALVMVQTEETPFDLVLTDWNMPVMNGFELLTIIRQEPKFSSMKVIMVTTETELDQMSAALEAGANEYVMKPFTKDILAEKLQLLQIHPCEV